MHPVGAAVLVAILSGTAALGTPLVVTRRRQQIQQISVTDGYLKGATDGPCSLVACPPLEKELELRSLKCGLRKYGKAAWVSVYDDKWKFKHTSAQDFLEAFNKIMLYRKYQNHMSQKIPITTPIVVELTAEETYGMTSTGRTIGFEMGFRMYYMIHPEYKDDPYVAPTDIKMAKEDWSPNDGAQWVAVHQWTHDHDFSGRKEPPAAFDEKKDILYHAQVFRQQLDKAFDKVGAPRQELNRLYYAAWGGPADRINEIWFPIKGNDLLVLESDKHAAYFRMAQRSTLK